MELIKEGKTKLYVYTGKISKKMEVFYNPMKKLDRDINVEIVKILKPNNFLDLMAGSGARGIRVANECGTRVILNDINPNATKLIQKNAKINDVKVEIKNEDANKLLVNSEEKYDFIDIDPFGSPIYFIENSINKIKNGKYLSITSTDVSPLYGSSNKRCIKRYGAVSLRTPFSREIGLRILIGSVMKIASRYEKYAEPIVSFFDRYYYRVYFKVYRKNKIPEIGFLFYNEKTLERNISEMKEFKCFKGKMAGPLYIGKLGKREIIEKIKGFKIIDLLKEEIDFPPFYYTTTELARNLKKQEIKISKLEKNLSSFSRTHFDPKGFRTFENIEKIKGLF